MKKIQLLTLLLFVITSTALTQGMNFEHNTTWENVIAKAKAENKHIFVDAYTTWCGPCKQMAAQVFPKEEVGKYYNANYVNVKLQMDKTKNDNEDVKSWYATAKEFEKMYNINAYPIYLIFNPSGELVHRGIGSSPAEQFIKLGESGLDPNKQFVTLVNQYKAGKNDAEFLKNVMMAAQRAGDEGICKEVYPKYIATQKDIYTKENLELIIGQIKSTNNEDFKTINSNLPRVNKVLGNTRASEYMQQLILQEKVFPKLFKKGEIPNWIAIEKELKTTYPTQATEVTLKGKMFYSMQKKEWNNYTLAASDYVKKVGVTKINSSELNSMAWSTFENITDKKQLEQATAWSRQSLEKMENAAYLDTYANLLHKTGKTKDAIIWSAKALEVAKKTGEDEAEYEATLEKIKKGEKTWK